MRLHIKMKSTVMKKNVLLLAVTFLLFAVNADHGTAFTVDGGKDTGIFPSMQIETQESETIIHVSYYDADAKQLKYAKAVNGEVTMVWTPDSSKNVGSHNALAADTVNSILHIAYYDEGNGNLKYLSYQYKPGWDFQIETLDGDNETDVGRRVSIALDGSGSPHISYYDATNKRLKYIAHNGEAWEAPVFIVENSPFDIGSYNSIAIDFNDDYHIVYYNATGKTLCYINKNQSTPTVIDPFFIPSVFHIIPVDVGMYASLALDSFDNPHIAYYDNTRGALKYIRRNGAKWEFEFVAEDKKENRQILFNNFSSDEGSYCSLKLDSSDNPHISYYNAAEKRIQYASYDGAKWTKTIPYDEPSSGPYSCIALDENDRAYIAFRFDNETLRDGEDGE